MLEQLEILFVCRDATRRIYTSRLGVGDRLPAHCSASGKILLAQLSEEELRRRLKGVVLVRRACVNHIAGSAQEGARRGSSGGVCDRHR